MKVCVVQMARTQALTVLLALLAADPGEVILDSIYGSGVANRVLMDLVDSPHTTLLQVRFLLCTPLTAHLLYLFQSCLVLLIRTQSAPPGKTDLVVFAEF